MLKSVVQKRDIEKRMNTDCTVIPYWENGEPMLRFKSLGACSVNATKKKQIWNGNGNGTW